MAKIDAVKVDGSIASDIRDFARKKTAENLLRGRNVSPITKDSSIEDTAKRVQEARKGSAESSEEAKKTEQTEHQSSLLREMPSAFMSSLNFGAKEEPKEIFSLEAKILAEKAALIEEAAELNVDMRNIFYLLEEYFRELSELQKMNRKEDIELRKDREQEGSDKLSEKNYTDAAATGLSLLDAAAKIAGSVLSSKGTENIDLSRLAGLLGRGNFGMEAKRLGSVLHNAGNLSSAGEKFFDRMDRTRQDSRNNNIQNRDALREGLKNENSTIGQMKDRLRNISERLQQALLQMAQRRQ